MREAIVGGGGGVGWGIGDRDCDGVGGILRGSTVRRYQTGK